VASSQLGRREAFELIEAEPDVRRDHASPAEAIVA